ncbi:VOC family protein [Mucilaginibacter panaciglaebae]|uniref:VOC family protein n=1 Tax=Mucilaginibacter panaciglaebae TaxID=502331 RepID=A0ABP7WML9_9SPHI
MFKDSNTFSSFSVNDLKAAKKFYSEVLGLEVSDNPMGVMELHIKGGGNIMVYPKPDHQPATFTVLNILVPNLELAVDALIVKGMTFEQYHNEHLDTDKKGIMRGEGHGPDIAWFKDPAGNILSLIEESK